VQNGGVVLTGWAILGEHVVPGFRFCSWDLHVDLWRIFVVHAGGGGLCAEPYESCSGCFCCGGVLC
jgi:hypothetical protein